MRRVVLNLLAATSILVSSEVKAVNPIIGNYVVTGTDSCLYSTAGFDSNLNAVSPQTFTISSVVQGFAHFDGLSTGTMKLTTISAPDVRYKGGIAVNPYATEYQGTISFTWAKDATDDGLFTATETVGTDIGSVTMGGNNQFPVGTTYIDNGVPTWNGYTGGSGRNHNLVMVTSAPGVESITYSNGGALQAICARIRTLIKADVDDTN